MADSGEKVQLYVYDLSNGLARQMSMALIGKQVGGQKLELVSCVSCCELLLTSSSCSWRVCGIRLWSWVAGSTTMVKAFRKHQRAAHLLAILCRLLTWGEHFWSFQSICWSYASPAADSKTHQRLPGRSAGTHSSQRICSRNFWRSRKASSPLQLTPYLTTTATTSPTPLRSS